MYSIKVSTKFKKDLKKIQNSGRKKSDLAEIKRIIDILAEPSILPNKNLDHSLSGNYSDYRECHIFPDLLLVYSLNDEVEELYLYRIGSHAELFKK